MTLSVLHPHKGQTVHQDFTATGTCEHPKAVMGAVVGGRFPKVTLVVGKTVVKQGRWQCTFHIKSRPGDYVLVLLNPLTGESQYVPIKIRKTPASFDGFGAISVLYPTPGCCFQSDDTAYGFAVVPEGSPDPNITSYFVYRDLSQSANGTPVDQPTSKDSYYWSQSFAGLATNNNPCRFHAQADVAGLIPVDLNNVTIIPDNQKCPNSSCDGASKNRKANKRKKK